MKILKTVAGMVAFLFLLFGLLLAVTPETPRREAPHLIP